MSELLGNCFSLEDLAKKFQEGQGTVEKLVNEVEGRIVEIVQDGFISIGYLHIDVDTATYYITSIKVENGDPYEFGKNPSPVLKSGTLKKNAIESKKRKEYLLRKMDYADPLAQGFLDPLTQLVLSEDKVLTNIHPGAPMEFAVSINGRSARMVGYANRPGWGENSSYDLTVYSFDPSRGLKNKDKSGFRMFLTYQREMAGNSNQFHNALALRHR